MSHIRDIALRVRDLDALEAACEQRGLELVRGQQRYAWWGRYEGDSRTYGEHLPSEMGKCDHAIRIKGTKPQTGHYGPWEIGVVKAKDGDGYQLYYDEFGSAGRALTERVGTQANGLRRDYMAEVATREAERVHERRGVRTERETLANGNILLTVRLRS